MDEPFCCDFAMGTRWGRCRLTKRNPAEAGLMSVICDRTIKHLDTLLVLASSIRSLLETHIL